MSHSSWGFRVRIRIVQWQYLRVVVEVSVEISCIALITHRQVCAPMGYVNLIVQGVSRRGCASMGDVNIVVSHVVVGVDYAKALGVGHRATRSTKDTVYVVLSICSRVKKMHGTTRRRRRLWGITSKKSSPAWAG